MSGTRKDFLLKVDETKTGNFITVAGLRPNKFHLNQTSFDLSDAESLLHWRDSFDGGAINPASISGHGIFKDKQSFSDVRTMFFSGTINQWKIVIPDCFSVLGPFQIVALEFKQQDSEMTLDIVMHNAGAIKLEDN